MYTYVASVKRVVDGDTVEVDIDLGFNTWRCNQSIRLLGCNAWELRTPAGKAAKANLQTLLAPGDIVTVRSVKADKYGSRFDAAVTLADGRDLVTYLIDQQWAAQWNAKGTAPVPPWPREIP